MMKILAIDPGTTQSAYVVQGDGIWEKGILENSEMRKKIYSWLSAHQSKGDLQLVVEMIQSFGMPVGREVFETVLFIGRCQEMAEISKTPITLVYRRDIKIHFCGTSKAKDGNIRQALIDKIGVQGTKKNPGPTYGISKDVWSALAVAVYYKEACHKEEHEKRT
jgi:hypothetical protein